MVDASALDIFNAANTLAREISPSTSSGLDQGGDGDVELAEMLMSPLSGTSSIYAASEQTGLTS